MKILFENKQLNEGPGAGYTVSGTLTNVKVNNIKGVQPAGKDSYGTYFEVELDAAATFEDVRADSYFYGGDIESTPVSIIRARINSDNEPTVEEVKEAIEGAKIDVLIGGGWSHTTFDGFIEGDLNKSPSSIDTYESVLDAILFELTNKNAIEYIDRAVSGELDEDEDFDGEIEESLDDADTASKPLKESFSEEDRVNALATYLNIEPSEISVIYDYEFETPEGDYLVVDEDEARELAEEDIRNLYDELGLESFTESFRDWIIMNALDNEWFEDAIRESFESYVEDIENEDGSMGYENRLIEEMHEHQVLSDDDFEIDEDGEPNLSELKEDVDIDDKKEEFIDLLIEDAGHPVDYCGDNYGWDWVAEMASQHNLIDMDEVVDECISVDGIAHFIARYDGDEIELENGLYAYRTN